MSILYVHRFESSILLLVFTFVHETDIFGFELLMRLDIWISFVWHTYVTVILFYISMDLMNHFKHVDLFWNPCPREF